MAGINNLTEIYSTKGKEFTEKLFDKHVTINEKNDGSSFSFEKNKITKKLDFYKRNTEIPISLIDRTLMKLYEAPIQYLEGLEQSLLDKIPMGWRFGTEYFANDNTSEIAHGKKPKNNLVLSYIHVKNNMGKLVRTVQDKEELDKWADLLNIERSPIIFQGHLSNEQKVQILEFLNTPFEKLVDKFKTESFVKHIIMILNPKLQKVLNSEEHKSIEGVVFRFGEDGDKESILAKLVDPVFELMSKNKSSGREEEPNDIFQLTVIDLTNFIESLNFSKFKPKGRDLETRYLNFICQVFNDFIEKFGDTYKSMKFNEPSFMNKKSFDLNTDFIKNDKTLELLKTDESFEKLFKIILASFRKKKKKPTGIFTSELIQQFNGTVDKIHDHLAINEPIALSESEIPTFGEFRTSRKEYLETDDDVDEFIEFGNKTLEEDVEKEPEIKQKETKKAKPIKGKTKVNIMVGRFQIIHNGHMAMAKDLYDINGLPVVLVVVHPGNNKSGKSPFTVSTINTVLQHLPENSEGVIKDYCVITRGFIDDVMNKLRELNYEPVLWGAGEDRIHDYKKQIEHNFKKDNELKIPEDFQLVQTDRYGSGTEVRKAIEDGDFGKFKSLVPKSVQGAYTLLKNDIEAANRAALEEANKIELL